MIFQKAVKKKLKAKICLEGAAGSGKTFSALLLAKGFGGKTALIDTENESSKLYADRFDFDMLDLRAPFEPEAYIAAISAAEGEGYENLIIDSGSHEWEGKGGCLEIQSALGGRYQDWDKVTPRHNKYVRAILDSSMNIITCLRSKTGYEMGDAGNGKMKVTKIGMQPVPPEGFDYENTIVFLLNQNNMAMQTKDRTGLFIGKDRILTEADGETIKAWLDDGVSKEEQSANDGKLIIAEFAKAKDQKELDQVKKGLGKLIKSLLPADLEAVKSNYENLVVGFFPDVEENKALNEFAEKINTLNTLKQVDALYKKYQKLMEGYSKPKLELFERFYQTKLSQIEKKELSNA